MGDFNREEDAKGSVVPRYRENWVFRTTYDYNRRYLLEYNGSYNGSSLFDVENRFAFFQSGAVGWMITEEQFIKNLNLNWLDMFKVRVSYGKIGDDNVFGDAWNPTNRFLHMTQWAFGGIFKQNLEGEAFDDRYMSPYTFYRELVIGNPELKWETVTKFNLGFDYSLFKSFVAGSIEIFNDKRRDILIAGNQRAVPEYFGARPPATNLGAVDVNGVEVEVRLNKQYNNLRLWSNLAYTYAKSMVIERDDPKLYPDYRKSAGYPLNQSRYYVDVGYINNWDELYGSTAHDNLDDLRLPGDYIIVDYDADGIISQYDNIPYSYSNTPLNTFNATIGTDYKGWSFFMQFYGVTNVDRDVPYTSLEGVRNTVFTAEGSYWTKDNMSADTPMPRWARMRSGYTYGTRYHYDASYLRLKNVEIGYTFTEKHNWMKSIGMKSLKLYVNGNNLWLYTKMPDDRESNYSTSNFTAGQGAYPMMKRYNFGLRISL